MPQSTKKRKTRSCTLCAAPLENPKENRVTENLLLTPCKHIFHRVCLRNWFRENHNDNCCPECKEKMEWRDARPLKKVSILSRKNEQLESELDKVKSLESEKKLRKAEDILKDREKVQLENSAEQRQEFRYRLCKFWEDRIRAKNEKKYKEQRNRILFILLLILILVVVFLNWELNDVMGFVTAPPKEVYVHWLAKNYSSLFTSSLFTAVYIYICVKVLRYILKHVFWSNNSGGWKGEQIEFWEDKFKFLYAMLNETDKTLDNLECSTTEIKQAQRQRTEFVEEIKNVQFMLTALDKHVGHFSRKQFNKFMGMIQMPYISEVRDEEES